MDQIRGRKSELLPVNVIVGENVKEKVDLYEFDP